jgi:hypothetical protein
MTKQILAFLFCFIRELTPLTLSLTSARELKPYLLNAINTQTFSEGGEYRVPEAQGSRMGSPKP